MEVFEFEVRVSTHDGLKRGRTALRVSKVLVAEDDLRAAYRTAVAMVWRGDVIVTSCEWVP